MPSLEISFKAMKLHTGTDHQNCMNIIALTLWKIKINSLENQNQNCIKIAITVRKIHLARK